MCLAIPAQVVAWVDEEHHIAQAEVAGVRRNVNVALLTGPPDHVAVGDWVLVHVGFAMSKIDEAEAAETRRFLEELGDAFEEEVQEFRGSAIE